jgi:hypothetical protein
MTASSNPIVPALDFVLLRLPSIPILTLHSITNSQILAILLCFFPVVRLIFPTAGQIV